MDRIRDAIEVGFMVVDDGLWTPRAGVLGRRHEYMLTSTYVLMDVYCDTCTGLLQ